MKRIKAVLGQEMDLSVAIGCARLDLWLWILPYRVHCHGSLGALQGRWGFMTFWPTWGRKHPAPARAQRRLLTGCLCLILALMTVTGSDWYSPAQGELKTRRAPM